MRIIDTAISRDELKVMAATIFGDMVKAVVDVDRELLAVDAELHADLESLLISDGSRQSDLWGINLYPDKYDADFVEFDSMINMRPLQGNKSRGVENSELRRRILTIVAKQVGA